MKVLIEILITVIVMLPVSGCYELIATNDKGIIVTGVEALMIKVDEFQNVFDEAAAADLTNAEETKKRNEQIDEMQEVMVAAKESIEEAPTLIEGVIVANQASVPVNPYAGIIDAVLKIIAGGTVIGGTAAGVRIVKDGRTKKGLVGEVATVGSKLKATNRANEKLRMKHPDIAEEHYELVGSERASI